jgi:hypothetical protein
MFSKVALIVEWDNARLSEVDRARQMLVQVGEQVAEVARSTNATFDLLLIYDPEEVPRETPETVVRNSLDATRWPGKIELIEVHGLSYYDQKNYGVSRTDADVIVFVDSDVVPDEGWLPRLMEAMKDPNVQIVSGETYLSTDSFADRVFAGFWLFDAKKPATGLYEARNFYANNVAIRGELIRANPFPTLASYRGQCAALAHALRDKGVKLYRDSRARVSHPPPEGFSHFVNRAICHGHDIMVLGRDKSHGWLRSNPLASLGRFAQDVVNTPRTILKRRQAAGLGPAEMAAAFGVSVAYSTLKLAGEVITFFSPDFVRKRFSI